MSHHFLKTFDIVCTDEGQEAGGAGPWAASRDGVAESCVDYFERWDICRDAVFPTFVGIPTFSDDPTFFFPIFFCFFVCECIVCVTTMRVNWWLSGQF